MGSIDQRVQELLIELGLIRPSEPLEIMPLAGGVSSDIFHARTGSRSLCVKFALPQLRVQQVWMAPTSRNGAEYAWLEYAKALLPELVPALFGRSARLSGFAMDYLEPARFPNWKVELLSGKVDPGFAAKVGSAIGAIHSHAATDTSIAGRFDNMADFRALRLDPYLVATASRHPDLAATLTTIADRLSSTRLSLVHGDVSPKNILCGPDGPVLLDAECAVHGDPAFDIAFCLNHLIIKQIARVAPGGLLKEAASRLWSSYLAQVDWEEHDGFQRRVATILPALMLARVDGKSPVDYMSREREAVLRDMARWFLLRPDAGVSDIIEAAAIVGGRA